METEIQPWCFTIEPYEGESISHFLGRFRRENKLTPTGLGKVTELHSAIARWEKFRFNPRPSPSQLEMLSQVVMIEVEIVQKMFPSQPMKMTPIRLCSACYGEKSYHRMEWQYQTIYQCNRHQLKLLSECPHCGARFKIPALWVNGWCDRCFIPFAQMGKKYKHC